MHEDMSHFLNHSPWSLRMRILKLSGKLIGCFAYNLNIINRCMKTQLVADQPLLSYISCIFLNIIDGSKDMFQPSLVSNWLSHKSRFYHG